MNTYKKGEIIKWGEPAKGIDGLFAAVQALKEGKPVQWQIENEEKGSRQWYDIKINDKFCFVFNSTISYRVGKPIMSPEEFHEKLKSAAQELDDFNFTEVERYAVRKAQIMAEMLKDLGYPISNDV